MCCRQTVLTRVEMGQSGRRKEGLTQSRGDKGQSGGGGGGEGIMEGVRVGRKVY